MARLASIGFELNSATANMEVTTVTSGSTIQTTTVRSGTYALQMALVSATARGIRYSFLGAAGNGPYFHRTYFRVDTLPSAENCIIELNDTSAFTTPIIYITIDSGGLLRLYDEDGVIGSASSALSLSTWYYIEIQVDRTAAAGSQVVRARLDGAEFAGSATRDLSAGVLSYNVGCNLLAEAQTVGSWYFDDIAINDNAAGGNQTSYPGASNIIVMRPNAAGDNSDWDSVTPFENIDEVTPDDATTIIQSIVSGNIQDVNLEATPGAMGSGDTINCIQVCFRGAESVITNPDPTMVLRFKDTASGTVDESASITINSTSYFTNLNGTPINPRFTAYDRPGSSDPLTKALLDTSQIGVRLTNTPIGFAQISTLWLIVDYTPGAGGSIVPVLMRQYRQRRN